MGALGRATALVLICASGLLAGCGDATGGGPGAASAPAPEAAGERISRILALDAPLRRAAEIAVLLEQLDAEALPAVREAFDRASIDRGDTELVLFATWWAGFDPEGAREWSTREWTAQHLSVLGAIFRTWARSDPETAWIEALKLPTDIQKKLASDAVIVGWYESGAPGLEEFIAGLPESVVKSRAADTLARCRTLDLGATRAIEWVEGLAAGRFRQLMHGRVAAAAALDAPEVTAAWAEPQIDGGHRTSGLARRVATRWVRSDPEAAMAWLAGLPAGGDREDGVLESYRDWLRLDREEAVAWMERQDVEPWLEPAFALYVRGTMAQRDAPAAIERALRMRDPDWRRSTATYIARRWLERDYEAADAWIRQSDLPPDMAKIAYMLPSPEVLEKRAARRAAREAERLELAPEPAASSD